jgi:hypothetical protein
MNIEGLPHVTKLPDGTPVYFNVRNTDPIGHTLVVPPDSTMGKWLAEDSRRRLGFLARELQPLVPEAVTETRLGLMVNYDLALRLLTERKLSAQLYTYTYKPELVAMLGGPSTNGKRF